MSPQDRLARLGFDLPLLSYFGRTALASCAALLVALTLGLEHPQWAAMTVWAASQPTRGQALEKGLFRVAGTASGVVAGVAFIMASHGDPLRLMLALSVWIALCAGIGNLQRGYVAYGTMLAGYSAAMVALLSAERPDLVLELGADRLLTILVGVAFAVAVGLAFAPPASDEKLAGRLRRLTARGLARLAGEPGVDAHDLLTEMAALEETLEPHGAGSLRSRRLVRAVRRLLMAEMALLPCTAEPGARVALGVAARALESGASEGDELGSLAAAAASLAPDDPIKPTLAALAPAFRAALTAEAEPPEAVGAYPALLHRDVASAWRAAARALVAMLVVGGLWVVSGASAGAFLLLGVAIMTSLFSTFDNPAPMMRNVFVGQAFGALAALACHFLVWRWVGGAFGLALTMIPFLLVAPLAFAHRRTAPSAFDYTMVFLLLSRPAYPPEGGFVELALASLAVITGPAFGWLAYRFLFPLDPVRRSRLMIAAMLRDLSDMAKAAVAGGAHPMLWRARLYHRLLRLTRLADRHRLNSRGVVDDGLRLLELAAAILALDRLRLRGDLSAPARRALDLALGRLAQPSVSPREAAEALRSAAEAAPAAEAAQLRQAAQAIGPGEELGEEADVGGLWRARVAPHGVA